MTSLQVNNQITLEPKKLPTLFLAPTLPCANYVCIFWCGTYLKPVFYIHVYTYVLPSKQSKTLCHLIFYFNSINIKFGIQHCGTETQLHYK